MKFDIEGLELSETISKYVKNEEYLEVEYLDGETDYISLEDEETVKEIQREQAIQYIGEYNKDARKIIKRLAISSLSLVSGITIVTGYNAIDNLMNIYHNNPNYIMGTALFGFLTYLGLEGINIISKLYDASTIYLYDQEKYLLYLEYENLFKKYVEHINLNTLDDYNYKEIRRLTKQLTHMNDKYN